MHSICQEVSRGVKRWWQDGSKRGKALGAQKTKDGGEERNRPVTRHSVSMDGTKDGRSKSLNPVGLPFRPFDRRIPRMLRTHLDAGDMQGPGSGLGVHTEFSKSIPHSQVSWLPSFLSPGIRIDNQTPIDKRERERGRRL